jgi:putative endonuclease
MRTKQMCFCYILFSPSIDKFYIGSTTHSVESRIAKHNTAFYPGNHFTHQTSDWELYLAIPCINSIMAKRIENHIKRMKSKKYIRDLKRYPELIEKLLQAE